MKFVKAALFLATALTISAHATTQKRLTVASSAQCEIYARKVLDAALAKDTASLFFLDQVSSAVELNDESGQKVNVETLSFAAEGAYAVLKTLPNYYGDGKCQLSELSISRH
jgi:hypothetical protein